MDEIIKNLGDLGLAGAIIAVLLYQVLYLQKKLISIIESNTSAFQELKGVIKECQTIHEGGK